MEYKIRISKWIAFALVVFSLAYGKLLGHYDVSRSVASIVIAVSWRVVVFKIANFCITGVLAPISFFMARRLRQWTTNVFLQHFESLNIHIMKHIMCLVGSGILISHLHSKNRLPAVFGGTWSGSEATVVSSTLDDSKQIFMWIVAFLVHDVMWLIGRSQSVAAYNELVIYLLAETVLSIQMLFNDQLLFVGLASALCMLASDVFITLAKMMSCIAVPSSQWLPSITYALLCLSFAYFRLIAFPWLLYHPVVSSLESNPAIVPVGIAALAVILVLHVYWFSLVVSATVDYARTGIPRDIHTNLSQQGLSLEDLRIRVNAESSDSVPEVAGRKGRIGKLQ